MERNTGSKILLIPRLLLVFLAIVDSVYLFFIENNMASCSVLGKTTCITILPIYSQHLYIPLPILGFLGFIFILALTILAYKNTKFTILRRLTAFFAFFFSVYLLLYMILIVHNICPFCLISFLLVSAFTFLEFVEIDKKYFGRMLIILGMVVIIEILGVYFVSLNYQPSKIIKESSEKFLADQQTLDLDYRSVYENSEKHLLVYVFEPDCGFCQYFVSQILTDPDVQKSIKNYSFYVQNVNLYSNFLKTMPGKITSFPTLVIWKKDGKQEFLTGLKSKEKVLKFLDDQQE